MGGFKKCYVLVVFKRYFNSISGHQRAVTQILDFAFTGRQVHIRFFFVIRMVNEMGIIAWFIFLN